MTTILQSLRRVLAFSFVFAAVTLQPAAQAETPPIVWQQLINYSTFSDWGPSQRSTSGSVDSEIADDFDVVGTISRIDVNGYGVNTGDAAFGGVYVRFYAYGPNDLPGTLQAEYFIPKGDPRILNTFSSADYWIDLGAPFQASGKHFVTVQVSSNTAWYWRSADDGAPRGPALYYRSSPQATWSHKVGFLGTANSDTAFTLYGTRTLTAPTISALSVTTLAQAGRLKISGSGFGTEQGTGIVTIGGATAPVSNWTDTSITAYVPDASPLGSEPVQVVTSGGTSNTLQLTVIARPAAANHVQWRFQADGLYIQGRAGIGPDGTIYALDVGGHLYALTPSGGVKWIFNTGPVAVQSVEVGPDGTIYFGSSVNKIYAVNPDGTLKWTITDPSGAQVGAGPDVGPDGNIYAVTEDAGLPSGLGEITISPAGQVLTNRPNYLTGRGDEFLTREIVFGPINQFYFDMNNLDNNSGLQFFQLGGNFLFARLAGGSDSQPAVDAGGNIYSTIASNQLGVFDSNGNLLRSSFFNTLTAPNVGSDGTIYVGENFPTDVMALNPDLSVKWKLASSIGYVVGPVVDSSNTLVVVGANGIGAPSAVQGIDAATGNLSWQMDLPAENGGFVRPMSRPRFSPDAATVYVGMDVNDSATDPYTYLYAFDTSAGATTDSVTILGAQYNTARHLLLVQATSSNTSATLQVFVTSTDTLIGTLTKKAGKYTGRFSSATNPQSVTVKSSLGGSATAAVITK